jgi:K+/H+ antiporter YhaU regulatory subunit KhtT
LLGQHAFELDPQLKLLKVKSGVLTGRHPTELEIRSRTGCSVIAVERGESLFTEFEDGFRFQDEDEVYVCGDQHAVERFHSVFSS